MKSWYEIKAQSDEVAEVLIYDQIGEDFWGEGVSAKEFARDVGAIKAAEILVRINSPGGSVFDGQAIYATLRSHAARIVTRVEGLAASIASLVAMAGDEVRMTANSLFMIHDPWAYASGTAPEMHSFADVLEKVGATIRDVYAARSALTADEVAAAMAAETWYTAGEAEAVGLIDVVDNMRAVAVTFDPDRYGFRRTPSGLLAPPPAAPEATPSPEGGAPEGPAPEAGAASAPKTQPVLLSSGLANLRKETT